MMNFLSFPEAMELCFKEHPGGGLAWFVSDVTSEQTAEGEENPAVGAGLFCFREAMRLSN